MVHPLGPLSGASQASLLFQANLCLVSDDDCNDLDDPNDDDDDEDDVIRMMTMMILRMRALNDRHVRLPSTNTVSRSLSLWLTTTLLTNDHVMMIMMMILVAIMMMMTMACQQIPTMTKTHHGGNLSVMNMVGICR